MMVLYCLMRLSSRKWEDDQEQLAASGKPRSFIILELAKGSILSAACDRVKSEMWSVPLALPQDSFTLRARSKLFRMLSALLCNLEATSARDHRTFPFLLFRLLEGRGHCEEVYSRPACCHDELAKTFFKMFPKPMDSQSAKAQVCLEAAAMFAQTDIADVECGHSSIREFTKQRGRGHTSAFSDVSAKVMLRFLRTQCNLQQEEPQEQESAQQSQQQGVGEQPKPQRPGTGGAWRAFVREMSKGTQFTPHSVKVLSQQYKRLTFDEYQHYKELGVAMTLQGAWARTNPNAGQGHEIVEATVPTTTLLDMDETTQFQLLSLGQTFDERYDKFWKSVLLERRTFHAEKMPVLPMLLGVCLLNFSFRYVKTVQLCDLLFFISY